MLVYRIPGEKEKTCNGYLEEANRSGLLSQGKYVPRERHFIGSGR